MLYLDADTLPPPDALVLDNSFDVLALDADQRARPVIVLKFPKWTDGRAYSQAVLLRARLRYAGEIRATGDVLADMLPLLRRCGFDAVQLRADQSLEAAERSLGFFDGHYQRDPGRPLHP